MKTYKGFRPGKNDFVADTSVWSEENGVKKYLPLEDSLKIRNHSPTGFNWGYGGSGPAQLALAILLDCFSSKELALKHYMQFKQDFVSRWSDDWEMTEGDILEWETSQTRE